MFNPLLGNCTPLYLPSHPETVRIQVFLESILSRYTRRPGGQAATAKNNIIAIEDATVDLDDFDTSESDVAVDKRGGEGNHRHLVQEAVPSQRSLHAGLWSLEAWFYVFGGYVSSVRRAGKMPCI